MVLIHFNQKKWHDFEKHVLLTCNTAEEIRDLCDKIKTLFSRWCSLNKFMCLGNSEFVDMKKCMTDRE